MNNNSDISIDFVREKAEKELNKFKIEVNENIDKISRFNKSNYNELLKLILNDCGDLSDYEYYIGTLEEKLHQFEYEKEKLLYQKTLTKKDIIDESILKLYGIYNINILSACLFTKNILEFIKCFLILSIIQASSFVVNLNYFTSEKRKKQIDEELVKIDEYIEINKYDIKSLYKFREIYIEELKAEVAKLFEISELYNPNYNMNYKKMYEFLKDIKLDFVLDDYNVKSKIRSR